MKITKKMINLGKSQMGGWSRAQLEAIGVVWPPQKGWMDVVCESEITEEQYERFMSLKNQHLSTTPTPSVDRATLDTLKKIKKRGEIVVGMFTDPERCSGSHTMTCVEPKCEYPACYCLCVTK